VVAGGFGRPPVRAQEVAQDSPAPAQEGPVQPQKPVGGTKVAGNGKAHQKAATARQSPVPAPVEQEPVESTQDEPVEGDEAGDAALDDFQGFLAAIDQRGGRHPVT
jgi:hypothetical protein